MLQYSYMCAIINMLQNKAAHKHRGKIMLVKKELMVGERHFDVSRLDDCESLGTKSVAPGMTRKIFLAHQDYKFFTMELEVKPNIHHSRLVMNIADHQFEDKTDLTRYFQKVRRTIFA